MADKIIDGKLLASQIRLTIKEDVNKLIDNGVTPGLSMILVGDNAASRTYVRAKRKACEELGINSVITEFPEDITEEKLLAEIERLNKETSVHGILVQLPLPKHISVQAVIERISPSKDVDGFHPINVGKLTLGQEGFIPCTPIGILAMLKSKNIAVAGKHVVVIGRSNIVGKPVGQLLLKENATVTYCHSQSENIKQITQLADILIVAVGQPKLITKEYIKEGAVVIDVGVNRLSDGKLCGDVDFTEAKHLASYITPVPGGVGPMTITMLLYNTVKAANELYKNNNE
ncbi:bifunctional methylenetetrahydrofolate dehydrogenase/methenyltetrahydrofolate cyclohydrolase [Lottiidibacillus patelloidae]|uniref:Bifunctional protein FolD n=1 Tax=Lottiidibacillus patelloidae TaxID=2670334 RepID=A0A263BV44_9BACI|nr:bifunctional methylenetetrahydrofolate dehydrogenase/methenyltetrahydrofolate cyclohydrolase FolD [Lottiidibacillus patelloidae]OZM57623.1 bifunctional methylenetetrahydrofolate dehydrogenase/methenyltetrahydrofolate cyclohydrolase [Lottiidibacillus patelloidae]